MKHNKIFLALSVALLSSTSIASHAAKVLEVIQITASKKSESIQASNIAVTAFSGEGLRELNMTDSTDIANQTPGLNIGTPVGEGNNPSISLRGVGLNDFNDNNEGPIAVYRDEVYQSAMPGLTFQLFDLERVEVLRGPQGTLYGRNATGGLIHFISNKPTEDLNGFASVTIAENNQLKTEGAISGGLTDTIQARLSVATNKHDGYVKNRIGKDANEADNAAVRLQMNFDLSDNLTALVNVHSADSETIAPQYQHQVTSGEATDSFGYTDNDNDNDVWAGEYDRPGVLKIESSGASAKFAYKADNFNLYSVTAVEDVEKLHIENADTGPTRGLETGFVSENKQFSQEFRVEFDVDSMEWMIGAYYFENEVTGSLDLDLRYPGPVADAATGSPAGTFGNEFVHFFNYDVDYKQETESVGLFGQVAIALNDKTNLTVGLRYTTEERSMNYQNKTTGNPDAVLNSCLIPSGDICGLGLGTDFPGTDYFFNFTASNPDVGSLNKLDDDNLSGRISLDYAPIDDILIFANIATGFKSGGFNGGFLDFTDGLTVNDVAFKPEELLSYELGFKSTLADGSIRLNGTAFYYDYKNYQALSFAGLSQFINNSDATVSGADIELTWLPGDNWDINLGASYINSEVDEVVSRGVGSIFDSEMVLAPSLELNGLVRYQATESLSLQVDFNHKGEQFFDITNSDVSKEDSHTIFNARIGYEINEHWAVSAFVKNLTDEEYRVYSFDLTGPAGFNQNFYAPPRWVGITIDYTYF